jgi:hypothetical protein
LTYHHYRRLSEHWPESAKHLRPAATLVALTIASHLNQESSRWAISAKTISTWANGLSRGSIDTAVKQLEALGIFGVSRESQRRPREFKLLVECPQGCERAKDHNTPNELKAALAKPQTEPTEMPNLETSSTEMPNLLATEMPNLEREMPNLLATNKESIEINKKDDIENSFEFIFVWETLAALKGANQLRADHALLIEELKTNPQSVIERAKEITAKATEPKSYLRGAIMKHPESLIKRSKLDKKPDYTPLIPEARIRSKWESFLINSPELIEFDNLSSSSRKFLQTVAKDSETLTLTSANLATKATRLGFDIGSARSVSEASSIIFETEQLLNKSL